MNSHTINSRGNQDALAGERRRHSGRARPRNPHVAGALAAVVPQLEVARCLAFEMVGYGSSIPEGRGRDISVARQAEYLVAWAKAI